MGSLPGVGFGANLNLNPKLCVWRAFPHRHGNALTPSHSVPGVCLVQDGLGFPETLNSLQDLRPTPV